jgi:hypothetical protein
LELTRGEVADADVLLGALASYGAKAAPAMPWIVRRLEGESRDHATFALAEIGAGAREYVHRIVDGAAWDEHALWYALGRIEPAARVRFLDALREEIAHSLASGYVEMDRLRTFSMYWAAPHDLEPGRLDLASVCAPDVYEAFGDLGAAAAPAVPELLAHLERCYDPRAAARAIRRIGGAEEDIARILMVRLARKPGHLTLAALGESAPPPDDLRRALLPLVAAPGTDAEVRAAACALLVRDDTPDARAAVAAALPSRVDDALGERNGVALPDDLSADLRDIARARLERAHAGDGPLAAAHVGAALTALRLTRDQARTILRKGLPDPRCVRALAWLD